MPLWARTDRFPHRRSRPARAAATAALVGAACLLLLLIAVDRGAAPRAAARSARVDGRHAAAPALGGPPPERDHDPTASVSLAPAAPTMAIPRSFLGLSTEYWTLPIYARHMALFERLVALLRVPGGGPLVLRIGGDSADHSLWQPAVRPVPGWLFALTPAWLRTPRRLARDLRLRVILDLNLLTASPASDAALVQAAERALPRGSLVGVEIGNEPDIYNRRYWMAMLAHPPRGVDAQLPDRLTPAVYARDFERYARALSRVDPRMPLIGPVAAYPRLARAWFLELIAAERRRLGLVSAHLYPFSACARRGSRLAPTIARLMGEAASAGPAHALVPVLRLIHRAGLALRLTELNSVTCGGRRGVSDTFADALWALDTLFELVRVRVDGVNVHLRATTINAPFTLSAAGVSARPLLYGLVMFARMLGPRAKLVELRVHGAAAGLKAWAVRVGGGALHVLLINQSRRSAIVELHLPAAGIARVERLLAPSAASHAGVTLAGQHLGPAATWLGSKRIERLSPGPAGYSLVLPADSAALVLLSVRPLTAPVERQP